MMQLLGLVKKLKMQLLRLLSGFISETYSVLLITAQILIDFHTFKDPTEEQMPQKQPQRERMMNHWIEWGARF